MAAGLLLGLTFGVGAAAAGAAIPGRCWSTTRQRLVQLATPPEATERFIRERLDDGGSTSAASSAVVDASDAGAVTSTAFAPPSLPGPEQ